MGARAGGKAGGEFGGEPGGELVHRVAMGGVAGFADVEEVEGGVPLGCGGERPGDSGERFRGEVGGEEHALELELRTGSGGAWADGEDGAANRVKHLLGDGATEQARETGAAVSTEDEQIDAVLADEGAGEVGDFSLLDPGMDGEAVEAMVVTEAGEEAVVVAVGGVGEGGHELGGHGELRGAQEMEEVKFGAEVAGDGESVFDGVLRTGSEVGGDGNVVERDARAGLDRHRAGLRARVRVKRNECGRR